MVAMAKTSRVTNTTIALLYFSTCPYFNMAVNIPIVRLNWRKVVMNQANQWTALLRPIIFITCKTQILIKWMQGRQPKKMLFFFPASLTILHLHYQDKICTTGSKFFFVWSRPTFRHGLGVLRSKHEVTIVIPPIKLAKSPPSELILVQQNWVQILLQNVCLKSHCTEHMLKKRTCSQSWRVKFHRSNWNVF